MIVCESGEPLLSAVEGHTAALAPVRFGRSLPVADCPTHGEQPIADVEWGPLTFGLPDRWVLLIAECGATVRPLPGPLRGRVEVIDARRHWWHTASSLHGDDRPDLDQVYISQPDHVAQMWATITATEHRYVSGHPSSVQIHMYGDSCAATVDVPEVFAALAEHQPRTLDELRELLVGMGAVDRTDADVARGLEYRPLVGPGRPAVVNPDEVTASDEDQGCDHSPSAGA